VISIKRNNKEAVLALVFGHIFRTKREKENERGSSRLKSELKIFLAHKIVTTDLVLNLLQKHREGKREPEEQTREPKTETQDTPKK
jgi:hypothetical protein